MRSTEEPAADDSNRNRRSLLRSAGIGLAAALALGTGGAAAEPTTEDCGWEYQCLPFECPEGGSDLLQRRYCCNGSCSGWENYGCCA